MIMVVNTRVNVAKCWPAGNGTKGRQRSEKKRRKVMKQRFVLFILVIGTDAYRGPGDRSASD
jgi:hypothetical protein